ncbi:hypothetical protein BaRGS_00010083, partial [Batillaria attramentaria]
VHTDVEVALYINSIDSINEQTMDFSVNAFVTQEWLDGRLSFFGLVDAPYLEMDSKLIDKFWVPDLYFSNEKTASFHSVTVPNKMLHLYSDGKIIYKLRVSVTATCPMMLQKYPMDEQTCTLYLRSFAFTENYLRFRWRSHSPMQWNPTMVLPQFRLEGLHPRNCSESSTSDPSKDCDNNTQNCTETKDATGSSSYYEGFTCIAVDFYLKRNLGYYMITIYIPSVLIVMLSWVSFWLSVDAVPARISLGILTVLTMTTQTSVAVSSLPKVSYVKAIDIWMATCLCFVFSSLLEYALVNVLERKSRKRRMSVAEDFERADLTSTQAGKRPWLQRSRTVDLLAIKKAQRVDNVSRYAFPATYILFCLVYFLIY